MVAAVVLVACMSAWTWLRLTDRVGPRAPLRDPATADGAVLTLTLYDVTATGDHTVTLERSGEAFVVRTDGPLPALGDVVTVRGAWRAADGVVDAEWLEDHPDRGHKGALGMAAIGFLVLGAPFWFRLDRGRVVARA